VRAVTVIADDRIAVLDHPDPVAGEGELLVRVHGAGLNRADLMQKAGFYPAPPGVPADIPGLEFAGVVEAVGAGTTAFVPGDRVFGICGGGGQAELLSVPAGQCIAVPDRLDLVVAGGVPEAYVTAHDALVTQAGVAAGEWVLVHAAGSGVGVAVLQIAKAFGAQVVGTARTPDKLERCRRLGLDAGIVPAVAADGAVDAGALAAAVRDATEGHGADVVVDLVGGAYVEASVAAAAPGGRVVVVGTLAGGSARLHLLTLMQRRMRLHGTVLRPRSTEEKSAAVAAFERDVGPWLAAGTIEPPVEHVVTLDAAPSAYDLLASNVTFGKVVLDVAAPRGA
jgi:NADPH2:quinone reductase